MGSWCQVTVKHEDQKLKSQVISCKLYATKHVTKHVKEQYYYTLRMLVIKKNDQQGN